MTTTEHIPGLLIVGAGYAGMHAAAQASKAGVPVTIVDPDGVHGFTTRLAAVAGGTAPPGDAFAPLEAFGHSVRRGRAVGVADGSVRFDDGSELAAEAVVITAGARPTKPDLPGIELASPLRTPADAIRLRHALDSADSLLIVGGGATGSQLAGAAAVARPELTIRIIDREPKLLAGLGDALANHSKQILQDRRVHLHLERELEQVEPGGLTLSDGRSFDGLVVWAGGFEPVVDELGAAIPRDEGRIRIDADLRIHGWQRTFAAGDVAAHRSQNGDLLPMAAQMAVQAGDIAGRNAALLLAGGDPTTASLSQRGWVIDLGGSRGVAKLGPIPLASIGVDRLPPLLHYGIDIKHLLEIDGPSGLRFAPGRYRPEPSTVEHLFAGRSAARG